MGEDAAGASPALISLRPISNTTPSKRVFYDPIYHGVPTCSPAHEGLDGSTPPPRLPHRQPYHRSASSSALQASPQPYSYTDDFSIYEYVHVRNPMSMIHARTWSHSCASSALPTATGPASSRSSLASSSTGSPPVVLHSSSLADSDKSAPISPDTSLESSASADAVALPNPNSLLDDSGAPGHSSISPAQTACSTPS